MNTFRLYFLVTLSILISTGGSAQTTGDYRSAASGNWGVIGTWQKFDGSVWAAATAVPPTSAPFANVTIRTGHIVVVEASPKRCANLTIETGATLYTNTATTTNRYVRVYGTSVITDGTFGGIADGIGLEFGNSVTLSGTGTLRPCRVRPDANAANVTLTIDQDMTLTYAGSTGGGGAGLYVANSANDNITVTINSGRTVTGVNRCYFNVGSSTTAATSVNATFNINGTLNLPDTSNIGLRVTTGFTCNFNVNGSLNLGRTITPAQSGDGTTNITVGSGGVLTVGLKGGTADFTYPAAFVSGAGTFVLAPGGRINIGADAGLDPVSGPIRTTNRTFSPLGTYAYVGTAAQVTGVDLPTTIANLVISNTAGVSLSGNVTITDTSCSIGTGAKLMTSNHVLTNNSSKFGISGTFQIDDGGWATGSNNFVYFSTSTLVFNTLSNFGVNNDPPRYWPDSIPNVTVNAGGITLNVSRTVTGVFQTASGVFNSFGSNLYVPGTVQLNGGGYFDNFSPTYLENGTLVYNTGGTYGVYNEWTTGSTVGYGVPKNVTIQNATLVTLPGGRTIVGTLSLLSGDLHLQGNTLTLDPAATLSETPGNTVIGSSGIITTVRSLNAPNGTDIGGLGLGITSAADLGSTLISRGPAVQTGGSNAGVARYFEITPTNNTGLNATLVFKYDESELNGIAEGNLTLFKLVGGTWTNVGGTVDPLNNMITLAGLDGFSSWTAGDIRAPLPIQLASFTASVLDRCGVRLNWTTISEINNYGFHVQRKNSAESAWSRMSVNLIPGNGTTNSPHHYSFIDNTTTSRSTQYRLEQIDLDGTIHFTEPIEIAGVTSVAEIAPMEFALKQNYPNPFNPSTEIKFSVQTTDRATLTVYNTVGQSVAVLFDGLAEAGRYYQVRLDATHFASGTYFYKLSTNNKTTVKKMLLMK